MDGDVIVTMMSLAIVVVVTGTINLLLCVNMGIVLLLVE